MGKQLFKKQQSTYLEQSEKRSAKTKATINSGVNLQQRLGATSGTSVMCQSGDTHCAATLKNKKTLLEKLSKQKTTTINLLSTGGKLKTEIMKNATTTSTKTTKMLTWGTKMPLLQHQQNHAKQQKQQKHARRNLDTVGLETINLSKIKKEIKNKLWPEKYNNKNEPCPRQYCTLPG